MEPCGNFYKVLMCLEEYKNDVHSPQNTQAYNVLGVANRGSGATRRCFTLGAICLDGYLLLFDTMDPTGVLVLRREHC
jgi:hypothetical protein